MMSTDISGGSLRMKLTVTADEVPDLFAALARVKEARRRTRRLKDLAAKGLVFERAGGAVMVAERVPHDGHHRHAERPRNMPEDFEAASWVEAWGSDAALPGDGSGQQA